MNVLAEAERTATMSPVFLGVTIAANAVELAQYFHEEYALDLGELEKSENRTYLPGTIPLTDEPITERIEISDTLTIHQRLDQSQSDAIENLRAEFSQKGWRLVAEADLSSGHVQQWRNGSDACQAQVTDWRHRAEQELKCWQLQTDD